MAKYSRTQVNKAGAVLKTNTPIPTMTISEAQDILTYWRYIHTPVINTFQSSLRTKAAKKYNKNGFIAQRLKRVTSIISKLDRQPAMKLSNMQDIAGIRVVMKRIQDVLSFSEELIQIKPHKFLKGYDYINNPKADGYRGVHFVFGYVNPKNDDADGLQIEVQIRTELQHIWATTIESMDIFMGSSMKSGQGEEDIKDFFRLASSAFSLRERKPVCTCHQSLGPLEILKRLVSKYDELKIFDKLSAFSIVRKQLENSTSHSAYQLIILDTTAQEVTITSYNNRQIERANIDYTDFERKFSGDNSKQVVLIATDKIQNLNRAYPNYFLDTRDFISYIEAVRRFLNRRKTVE